LSCPRFRQPNALRSDRKAYQAKPQSADKTALEARFDLLVGQQTDSPTTIGSALKEMHDHKDDLLRVLERAEVPLHNNGSESIIRGYVKTRKISGSTGAPPVGVAGTRSPA
jgi:hypothetical protein